MRLKIKNVEKIGDSQKGQSSWLQSIQLTLENGQIISHCLRSPLKRQIDVRLKSYLNGYFDTETKTFCIPFLLYG